LFDHLLRTFATIPPCKVLDLNGGAHIILLEALGFQVEVAPPEGGFAPNSIPWMVSIGALSQFTQNELSMVLMQCYKDLMPGGWIYVAEFAPSAVHNGKSSPFSPQKVSEFFENIGFAIAEEMHLEEKEQLYVGIFRKVDANTVG
jgi:hypothetical protein